MMRQPVLVRPQRWFRTLICLLAFSLASVAIGAAQSPAHELELTRTIRTWEFLPVVGTRAGVFGDETGRFEAWVYPLKIFRGLHLIFHIGDRALPAESLARTLTVRPESASILFAGDNFRVRETLCVPVNESGVVLQFDVETEQPLEIEAAFTPDFQLEWPAALGGTYGTWDAAEHAFVFGEETRKYAAVIGSATASDAHLAYQTNYSSSEENSLRLGASPKGKDSRQLVVAASVNGFADALQTFHRLQASVSDAMRQSADYYQQYMQKTVSLELPDPALQQAYDWARISTIQGLVNNPYLGTGLVAGYRTSGVGQRPGFAWFFGRDSLWTSFALNAEGDYTTSRSALEFISKFQREDGKVPHEISQSASLVPWFKDYPYAYVSADATPLFILAMNDYVMQSGDAAFLQQKWDNVWRAYQFLRSTYDEQGLAKNAGVGHGWVEGGPLLPVKNEYYQAGLGVAALQALSNLARIAGKEDIRQQLASEFDRSKATLEQEYWSPDIDSYSFAVNAANQRSNEASVLTMVPMWFGLPDATHADHTITKLAAEEHQTDWGMRIISRQSKVYDGSGYHYGSVWPLFTGWASVAEYRYHREFPAYANLRSNTLLAFDGALGHFTEVLSGDYNQSFSTSSPHQIWSAAMVVSPMLRGLFGLEIDAEKHHLMLAPHVPADWDHFALHGIHVGTDVLDIAYHKTADTIALDVKRSGTGECWLDFSPAFSLRTQVVGIEINGRSVPFKLESNANDQHLKLRFRVDSDINRLVIRTRNDFGLTLTNELPALGSGSRGLRVISQSWNSSHSSLALELSGVASQRYRFSVWNPSQIASVDGGTIAQGGWLEVEMPSGPPDSYAARKVVLHFR